MTGRRVTGVAILVYIALALTHARTPSAQPQPATATSEAGFVGAAACASCHQEVHDTWKGGRHSKMLQPATAASVKGDFSKSERHAARRRAFRCAPPTATTSSPRRLTGKPQEHRVEYTLGSRRIQHYLTTIEKGMIVVLPPTWDVQRREWMHNMDIVRPDENHQTARAAVEQGLRRLPRQPAGEPTTVRRPATYATTWRDFGTSCERCHGPGSAHVEASTRADAAHARRRPRRSSGPTRLDRGDEQHRSARSATRCATPSIPAIRRAEATTTTSCRGSNTSRGRASTSPYWPDGRPRRFSNDAIGLWQSECFLRGGATCTSCHRDPHEPDVDRNPQLASSNNALCTGCHQQIGTRLDGAHASPRRQRGQFVRRVPHAKNRDQHQGDDARSHDQPAGAGEHRRVRHPERLHRMPRRQEAGVGRRDARRRGGRTAAGSSS